MSTLYLWYVRLLEDQGQAANFGRMVEGRGAHDLSLALGMGVGALDESVLPQKGARAIGVMAWEITAHLGGSSSRATVQWTIALFAWHGGRV